MPTARIHSLARASVARGYSTSSKIYAKPSPPAPAPEQPALDSLCIPIEPPYSISSYIPANPPKLSRATLTKLHKLAALEPPSTEAGWDEMESLDELVAIVESVRQVDTSGVAPPGQIVDARVRAEPRELDLERKRTGRGSDKAVKQGDGYGRQLLNLASKRDGAYFVVPTPGNVRGKKRSSAKE